MAAPRYVVLGYGDWCEYERPEVLYEGGDIEKAKDVCKEWQNIVYLRLSWIAIFEKAEPTE